VPLVLLLEFELVVVSTCFLAVEFELEPELLFVFVVLFCVALFKIAPKILMPISNPLPVLIASVLLLLVSAVELLS
jgi:hypothetical protein